MPSLPERVFKPFKLQPEVLDEQRFEVAENFDVELSIIDPVNTVVVEFAPPGSDETRVVVRALGKAGAPGVPDLLFSEVEDVSDAGGPGVLRIHVNQRNVQNSDIQVVLPRSLINSEPVLVSSAMTDESKPAALEMLQSGTTYGQGEIDAIFDALNPVEPHVYMKPRVRVLAKTTHDLSVEGQGAIELVGRISDGGYLRADDVLLSSHALEFNNARGRLWNVATHQRAGMVGTFPHVAVKAGGAVVIESAAGAGSSELIVGAADAKMIGVVGFEKWQTGFPVYEQLSQSNAIEHIGLGAAHVVGDHVGASLGTAFEGQQL